MGCVAVWTGAIDDSGAMRLTVSSGWFCIYLAWQSRHTGPVSPPSHPYKTWDVLIHFGSEPTHSGSRDAVRLLELVATIRFSAARRSARHERSAVAAVHAPEITLTPTKAIAAPIARRRSARRGMPLRPVGRRVPAGRAGRAAAHSLILRGPLPPSLLPRHRRRSVVAACWPPRAPPRGSAERLNFLAYYYNKAVSWNKDGRGHLQGRSRQQRRGLRL